MKTSIKTYLSILLLGIAFGTTSAVASNSQELNADPSGGEYPPPPPPPPTGK